MLGTMLGMLTWAVLLVIFGPSAFPRWRPRQLKEVARFGTPAALAGSAAVGYGNVDYSVLGATLSAAQVGFYYRAYALGVLYQNRSARSSTGSCIPSTPVRRTWVTCASCARASCGSTSS